MTVSSTNQLLNDVVASVSAPTKPLAIVPGFAPGRVMRFRRFELLHALGEITTPPVPNFANLSATWAMVRYIWAFEADPAAIPALRRSAAAVDLDFYQKILLSGEIGVGLAALVMKLFFGVTKPGVDVSAALKTPRYRLHRRRRTRRTPDYLFHNHAFSGHVYIVECKGNQTSYQQSINQLSSGAQQVRCVRFTNNRPTTSLVIASDLSSTGDVYVLDPPAEEDGVNSGYSFESGATDKGRGQWVVEDPERFGRELARTSAAQLLTYAGDFESAYRVAMVEPSSVEAPFIPGSRIATRENDLGVFEGRSSTQSLPDGTVVTLFRGIDAKLRKQLIATPESDDGRRDTSAFKDRPFVVVATGPRQQSLASVSSAGTMLEIRFSARG